MIQRDKDLWQENALCCSAHTPEVNDQIVWDEMWASHLSSLTPMKNEEGDLKYHPGPDSRQSIGLKGAQGAFHDYSSLENSESLIRKNWMSEQSSSSIQR